MREKPKLPSSNETGNTETHQVARRTFLQGVVGGAAACALACAESGVTAGSDLVDGVALEPSESSTDVFSYLEKRGGFELDAYRRILGAANELKEGDVSQGVAAADEASRQTARDLLRATRLGDLVAHPVFED